MGAIMQLAAGAGVNTRMLVEILPRVEAAVINGGDAVTEGGDHDDDGSS